MRVWCVVCGVWCGVLCGVICFAKTKSIVYNTYIVRIKKIRLKIKILNNLVRLKFAKFSVGSRNIIEDQNFK